MSERSDPYGILGIQARNSAVQRGLNVPETSAYFAGNLDLQYQCLGESGHLEGKFTAYLRCLVSERFLGCHFGRLPSDKRSYIQPNQGH